jgi:hypothetical protein
VLRARKLLRSTNELDGPILESLDKPQGGLSVLADFAAGRESGQRVNPRGVVGDAPAGFVVRERLIGIGDGIAILAQTHPRQTSARIRVGIFGG